MHIKIEKMSYAEKIQIPQYATPGSAGLDIKAYCSQTIKISPMQKALISTGFCIHLPKFFEAQIRSRSGLALKHGITVLNSPGTIDSDYRGEVKVILINLGKDTFEITPGMRIAQMIISKYESVTLVENHEEKNPRGSKGFGSSGI